MPLITPCCTYCGKKFKPFAKCLADIPRATKDEVAEHMEICGQNPFVKRIAALQAQLHALRWRKVEEELPEVQDHKHACGHSVHVWVYYGNLGLLERKKLNIPAGYDTDIYHHPTKSWMSGMKPTFWTPIPELPKGEWHDIRV